MVVIVTDGFTSVASNSMREGAAFTRLFLARALAGFAACGPLASNARTAPAARRPCNVAGIFILFPFTTILDVCEHSFIPFNTLSDIYEHFFVHENALVKFLVNYFGVDAGVDTASNVDTIVFLLTTPTVCLRTSPPTK